MTRYRFYATATTGSFMLPFPVVRDSMSMAVIAREEHLANHYHCTTIEPFEEHPVLKANGRRLQEADDAR